MNARKPHWRANPDDALRKLQRRVGQGDVSAVWPLVASLERAELLPARRVLIVEFSSIAHYGSLGVSVHATMEGAVARVAQWVKSGLSDGEYYEEAADEIRDAIGSGDAAVVRAHDNALSTWGWEAVGDRRYEINEETLLP